MNRQIDYGSLTYQLIEKSMEVNKMREQVEITCPQCKCKFKEHGVKREKDYLYFLGKTGNVEKAKMQRKKK